MHNKAHNGWHLGSKQCFRSFIVVDICFLLLSILVWVLSQVNFIYFAQKSAFYTYLYREGKKHPLTGKGKKPQTYKCQNWTVFYLNVLLFSWISHVAFFIVTFPLPPLIYTCVPEVCFLWSVGFFSVCTPTYPLSTPLSFWTFLLAVATKAKIIHLWIVRRVISVI